MVSDVPGWLLLGIAFAFGACWGSFFNVAIYRWPRGISVVTPPSHCPQCGTRVPARFNLPIIGYFILRGRTACCGAPLSPRYPIIELLSAVLCVAVARRFMLAPEVELTMMRASMIGVAYFFFVGGLLVATFVDLEYMEIPDEVSLPGAALGLVTAVFRDPPGVESAALGAGAGFLVIQLIFVWSYEHIAGRRGMGEGDSKLLMMIGAFVGWQGALFAVFAGAAQGLLAFVISRVTGVGFTAGQAARTDEAEAGPPDPSKPAASTDAPAGAEADGEHRDADADEDEDAGHEPPPRYWGHFKVPFGPFLALAAIEYLFFGEALTQGWFDLLERLPFRG